MARARVYLPVGKKVDVLALFTNYWVGAPDQAPAESLLYQSASPLLQRLSKTQHPHERQSLLVLRVSKILAEEAINNMACFSESTLSSH